MLKVILVHMGLYKHWALLSDRIMDGKPMLISNTLRNGTVAEESWDLIVGNRKYEEIDFETGIPPSLVLAKARNSINRVKYDFFRYNCEHFVREILTGVPKSTQVSNLIIGGCLAISALYIKLRKR